MFLSSFPFSILIVKLGAHIVLQITFLINYESKYMNAN